MVTVIDYATQSSFKCLLIDFHIILGMNRSQCKPGKIRKIHSEVSITPKGFSYDVKYRLKPTKKQWYSALN